MTKKEVKIDPSWNKVTLNADKRVYIMRGFSEPLTKILDEAEARFQSMGDEVQEFYLSTFPEEIKREINRASEEGKWKSKIFPHGNPFNQSYCIKAKIILTDAQKKWLDETLNDNPSFGGFIVNLTWANRSRDYFVPPKNTRITIKGGSSLGGRILKAKREVNDIRRMRERSLLDFEILLKSCKNIGQLLRKWPQAIDFIPGEWRGNDPDKQLAPINIMSFEENLKTLMKKAS